MLYINPVRLLGAGSTQGHVIFCSEFGLGGESGRKTCRRFLVGRHGGLCVAPDYILLHVVSLGAGLRGQLDWATAL